MDIVKREKENKEVPHCNDPASYSSYGIPRRHIFNIKKSRIQL